LKPDEVEIDVEYFVALYGTTGSFWNKLANVDTFEEINRLSRDILINSKDIMQGFGYELLYARFGISEKD